jgi:large subunit ribosomal protein L9
MKIILNQDVPNLGEMGDIKTVADGYARNFLLPRGFALQHNAKTIALFEKRKAEIDAHKEGKRLASSSLKEKLEAEEISITMHASANGKLFGAVTSQTIVDEFLKKGVEVDKKKLEIPDKTIKSAGNYKVIVRLYEKEEAVVRVVVIGQEPKKSEPAPERPRRHKRYEERQEAPAAPEGAQAGVSDEAAAASEHNESPEPGAQET